MNVTRTIVISEPHAWDSPIQVGTHHYAQQFLRDGCRVVFVSAPINLNSLVRGHLTPARRQLFLKRGVARTSPHGGMLIEYIPFTAVPTALHLPGLLDRHRFRFVLPPAGAALRRFGVERVDLLWLNGVGDEHLMRTLRFSRSILRVLDLHCSNPRWRCLESAFLRVLEAVDVVICTSAPVADWISRWRKDLHIVRNGVDVEHFEGEPGEPPDDLRQIPHPRAIYVGAISAWFDFPLLREVALLHPAVHFVLVGPMMSVPPSEALAATRALGNVHFLGPRPYNTVPRYLGHADLAIVPFARNQLVNGVSPLKVYEYLAAGLPVVTTYWPELEAAQLPVRIARDRLGFGVEISAALAEGRSCAEHYRAFARQNSWSERYRTVCDILGIPRQ